MPALRDRFAATAFTALLGAAATGAPPCRNDGATLPLAEDACPDGVLLAKRIFDKILATLEPFPEERHFGVLHIPGLRAPYWDEDVVNLWITPDFLKRFGADRSVLAFLMGHELAHPELDRRRAVSNNKVDESQADLLGLHLAVGAGYSRDAYLEGARRMLSEPALRTPEGRKPLECATHPCVSDRLLNLGAYAPRILEFDAQSLFGAAPLERLLDRDGRVRPSALIPENVKQSLARALPTATETSGVDALLDEIVDPVSERERIHALLIVEGAQRAEAAAAERSIRERFRFANAGDVAWFLDQVRKLSR